MSDRGWNRLTPLWGRVGVAASGLLPVVSLLIQLILTPRRKVTARAVRAVLMGSPLLAVALVQWVSGDIWDATVFGGLGLTITLLSLFAFAETRIVFIGSTVGLLALLALAGAVYYADTFRWHSAGPSELALASSLVRGPDVLSGRPNFAVSGYRGWETVGSGAPRSVVIDLASESGFGEAAWMGANSDQPGWQELDIDGVGPVTQIDFEKKDQFLYRSVFLRNELAERQLRARIDVRSTSSERACGHVALGRHASDTFKHERICAGRDWAGFEVEYAPGVAPGSRQFDFVVGGFTEAIQVRAPGIFLTEAERSVDLGPMMPTGATLQVTWNTRYPWQRSDIQELLVTAVPSDGGFRLRADLPDDLPEHTRIWTSLLLEDGGKARVVRVEWTGGDVRPAPSISRLSLWYAHPNLLGHSAAALGVAAIIVAPTFLMSAMPLALASALTLLSGSRTAFATLLLLFIAWVASRVVKGSRVRFGFVTRFSAPIVLISILVLAGAGLYLIGSDVRWSLVDVGANAPTGGQERLAIWRFALAEIMRFPALGSGEPFASAWSATHPGAATVQHAHNGLLDLGFRAGLLGIFAGLIPGALLLGNKTLARRRVLLGLFALALLSSLDATYMVPTVLAPLAFAIYSHGEPSNIERSRSVAPELTDIHRGTV